MCFSLFASLRVASTVLKMSNRRAFDGVAARRGNRVSISLFQVNLESVQEVLCWGDYSLLAQKEKTLNQLFSKVWRQIGVVLKE